MVANPTTTRPRAVGSPGRLRREKPPTTTKPGPQKISTMLALPITKLTIQSMVKAKTRINKTFKKGRGLVRRRAAPAQVARPKTIVVRVLMGDSLGVSTDGYIAACPAYSEY
jgi:hypothetical protein